MVPSFLYVEWKKKFFNIGDWGTETVSIIESIHMQLFRSWKRQKKKYYKTTLLCLSVYPTVKRWWKLAKLMAFRPRHWNCKEWLRSYQNRNGSVIRGSRPDPCRSGKSILYRGNNTSHWHLCAELKYKFRSCEIYSTYTSMKYHSKASLELPNRL